MISNERQEFLQNRKSLIGGSDVASILGVGDYACALRVYNDKTGVEPDFPDMESKSAQRGREMEDFVASMYAQKTKRRLTRVNTRRMEGKPFLGSSFDRVIHYDDGTQGYLEIKVLGYWSFKKVKDEGLYDEYVLQVQHGMRVTGLKRGAFAIFCPEVMKNEGWELLTWDFTVEDKLADKIEDAATDFWKLNITHKIPPNKLPDGSKPCPTCAYSVKCWGLNGPTPPPKKTRKKKGDKNEPASEV